MISYYSFTSLHFSCFLANFSSQKWSIEFSRLRCSFCIINELILYYFYSIILDSWSQPLLTCYIYASNPLSQCPLSKEALWLLMKSLRTVLKVDTVSPIIFVYDARRFSCSADIQDNSFLRIKQYSVTIFNFYFKADGEMAFSLQSLTSVLLQLFLFLPVSFGSYMLWPLKLQSTEFCSSSVSDSSRYSTSKPKSSKVEINLLTRLFLPQILSGLGSRIGQFSKFSKGSQKLGVCISEQLSSIYWF